MSQGRKQRRADTGRSALGRREFVTANAALAASLAMPPLQTAWAEASPRKGGQLRVGLTGAATTNTLDPATFDDAFMRVLGYSLRNNLTEIAPDRSLVGELAESWEPSDSARTWAFELRRGVEFHNGKSLNADDVVASINHHRGEESKSGAKAIVADISDIKADDKHRVIITLNSGNADFPYLMSDYHLAIMPAIDGRPEWESGIGTGGYAISAFDPGVSAKVVRAANYWKPDRAFVEEALLISLADPASRTSALVAGEVDAINRCDLKVIDHLERTSGLRVEEATGFEHYSAPMLIDVAPFDDYDVRQALKHAIDREQLLQFVLRGRGVLGNDHPISPNHRFHAAHIPQRVYDPDKAKYHLKKAGQAGLRLELHTAEAPFAGAVDAAVAIKEHASKAGIEIDVHRQPDDGYWSAVWTKVPWCIARWGGRPTEDWMFSQGYSAGSPWNDTRWNNDRFEVLLRQARVETDDRKRAEMYGEMQELVHDQGGAIVFLFANWVYAMSDKLAHGDAVSPVWDLDGNKIVERWWFK